MARSFDFVLGALLGAAATSALVAVAADSPSRDPVKVWPQDYTVLLENERVRVLEWRLKPGGKEQMHSHPDRVSINLGDATLKTTDLGGAPITSAVVKGDVKWRPAVSHAVENVGSAEAHSLIVELKSGGK